MEEKEIKEKLSLLSNFLILVRNVLDHGGMSAPEALDITKRMLRVLKLGAEGGT